MNSNRDLLARLENIRAAGAVAAGIARDGREATEWFPSVPKLAIIGTPMSYTRVDGAEVDANAIDLVARVVSMGRLHAAYALTAGICTAIAAAIPRTVVADLASCATKHDASLRLGHLSGTLEIGASVRRDWNGTWQADTVSTTRTARRLMERNIFVPDSLFLAPIPAVRT